MPTSEPAGLYIHVPFCRGKCPYCDFASVSDLSLIPAWLAALAREMRLYRDFAPLFDTLYLGGGTPSLLAEEQLGALWESLQRHFTFSPDAEITLEANPDDLTPATLKNYQKLGINRLSLGVQSFDDRDLTFLGRRHQAFQAVQGISWAREAGFADVGLDLIYGLPGQTLEAWQGNLETALGFRPEHLSCYQLTLEAGTPMARWQAEGRFLTLSEEEEREFFLFTSAFLEEHGYLHYEISNFARGPENRSRQNRKYWSHSPYLGLGPGAHSFRDDQRWWNHRAVDHYCQVLSTEQAPVAGREVLTPEQRRLEALYLGVRTKEGVALEVLGDSRHREAVLREVTAAGLMEVCQDRLVPTREGFVVADRLTISLME